jgi:hypothetical protein
VLVELNASTALNGGKELTLGILYRGSIDHKAVKIIYELLKLV